MYLKLRESDIGLEEFYRSQSWGTQFLLTEAGKPYTTLFETVKIRSILYSLETMQIIKSDNILPKDWIQSAYEEFCQYSLKIITKEDLG